MSTRRLFITLDVPAAVRDALTALCSDDLDGARWTKPEQLHCTLRFLGDTPEEQIPEIEAALAALDTPPPLDLRLDGLTAFPSRRRPRVLVARIPPDDDLLALQQRIENAMQRLGFEAESRRFRPHITVARLKRADAGAVHAWLRTHTADAAFSVDAFHLYASVLTPSGAVHERLASFPLAGTR
jgi:2'-5' RNA ligase